MAERRIAVVTGGAKGIGAAVADRLERDGLVPVVWDIAAPAAAGRSHLICDVSDERAVAQAAAATESEHGPIAVLVNNAGLTGPSAMVADTPLAQWQKVQAINLTGTFLCSRVVAAAMLPRGSGRAGSPRRSRAETCCSAASIPASSGCSATRTVLAPAEIRGEATSADSATWVSSSASSATLAACASAMKVRAPRAE